MKPLTLTRACSTLMAFAMASFAAFSQSLSFTGSYTQNFSGMGPTGLSLPPGWFTGTAAAPSNIQVGAVSDGSASGFNRYNYGLVNAADRALGSLSGLTTGDQAHEVRFVNAAGCTISQLQLRYDGEQWRVNGNTSTQSLTVRFSGDGGATFSNLPASFTFNSPVTAGNGALNGDVPPNRTAGVGGVFSVSLAPGAVGVIRWVDPNDAGNDHGLAIDNVRLDITECLPAYAITDVQPRTLTTGDEVRVTGTGLEGAPGDACLIGAVASGAVVLRVKSRSPTGIIAVVEPVPPGGGVGPLMFASGEGVTAGFDPAFADLLVRAPVQTLLVSNTAVVSPFNVTFIASPPPTNSQWFFSTPANNGQVTLIISGRCPLNAQISIRGSLRVSSPTSGLKDIDAGFPQLVWQPGGSALECARRVCDSLRCAFLQTRGVQLACEVTALPDGTARITLGYPGGSINPPSRLIVCVTEPAIPRPVITSITPLRGGRGTIFTLTGSGFGNKPEDLCPIFGRGGSLQPVRALTATDTRITVQLDIVAAANAGPDWRPMVVRGVGGFSDATARGDDLPGLTFGGTGEPAVGDQLVTFDPTPQNAADVFDDSTGPTPCTDTPVGGLVTITLDNANCVEGSIIKLDGHWDLRDCNGRVTHVDAWLPNFTYHTADGTCADVIKAALDARFFRAGISTAGFPITTWIDTDPVTGKDRLNIACDSGDVACPCCIVSSWVRVKYCPPITGLGQNANVASVSPSSIGSLGTVTINGSGLPTDAEGVCLRQKGASTVVIWPLRAGTASASQIVAVAATIPAGAEPGPVIVMGGVGVRGPTIPVIWDDLRPGADGWFFSGRGGAVNGGMLTPNFNQPPPDPNTTWVTGALVNGRYCIYFSNACPAGTILNIQADFTLARPGGDLSVDQVLNGTVWTTGGSAYDCANRICDLVGCGLKVKLGVKLKCEVTALPGGVAKATFSDTNAFRFGYLSVCATTPAAAADPVITDVRPLTGRAGDLIEIFGDNFGTDPRRICNVMTQPNDCRLIPFTVLQADNNRILAMLDAVPDGAVAGRIAVALGDFDEAPPAIAFNDVVLGGPFWAWTKRSHTALAPVLFQPIPSVPTNQICIEARCVENEFCITLTNTWSTNSVLCITARAHNAAGQGGDVKGEGIGIFPAAGSTTMDCVRRLAAILQGEFARQSSIQVAVTVQDLGNNQARLCISGATAPLTSGLLRLYVKPCTDWIRITCPGTITVSNCIIPRVAATVAQSCLPANTISFSQQPPTGTRVPPGSHVVTVTACDPAGHCTTCTTTVNAVPDPAARLPLALFNTGVDPNGNPLPGGAVDAHYGLSASADPGAPPPNAEVTVPVNPAWITTAASPLSRWISPRADTDTASEPNGAYTYRINLDLTGFDPATAVITGRWAADDSGEVWLNGQPVPGTTAINSFRDWTPFNIAGGFSSTFNVIEFRTRNTGGGPTGMRVEIAGSAQSDCVRRCVAPPNGLTLWLTLDELTGAIAYNAVDNTPNGQHYEGNFPLAGTTFRHQPGKVNGGGFFDGYVDNIRVPNYAGVNPGAGDFTLDAWILLDQSVPAGQQMFIAEKRGTVGAGERGYAFFVRNNRLGLRLADSGGATDYLDSSAPPLQVGRWHFVAVTVCRTSASGIRFYVDGQPTGTGDPTLRPGSLDTGVPFVAGGSAFCGMSFNFPSPCRNWRGKIDELEMFCRCLPASDVQKVWAALELGKCRLDCHVEWDTKFASGSSTLILPARFCNHSGAPQTVQWAAVKGSCGSFAGAPTFAPASGTLVLPPGACVTIPITVTRPPGITAGQSTCIELIVDNAVTGERATCEAKLIVNDTINVNPNNGGGVIVVTGNVATVTFTLANTLVTESRLALRWTLFDGDMLPNPLTASLNGLPPGQPAEPFNITLAPLAALNLTATVRFLTCEPRWRYPLVLEAALADQPFVAIGSVDVQSAFPAADPLPPPPALTLRASRSGDNVRISWDEPGDWTLEETGGLMVGADWQPTANGTNGVVVPLTGKTRFFRLRGD